MRAHNRNEQRVGWQAGGPPCRASRSFRRLLELSVCPSVRPSVRPSVWVVGLVVEAPKSSEKLGGGGSSSEVLVAVRRTSSSQEKRAQFAQATVTTARC